ncbi:MAG: hypothetical protein OHK006_10570 [Thermodesulfovibrionales bacterium]
MWSVLVLIFLTLCAGLAAWLFFIWAVKSGQYDDAEGPKYRMLEDDDESVGVAGTGSGADKKPESDKIEPTGRGGKD